MSWGVGPGKLAVERWQLAFGRWELGLGRAALHAVRGKSAVEEGLRPGRVGFVEVLDDDRDVRVLPRQPDQVEVVIERAETWRGQLDRTNAPEGVPLGRIGIADIGVLLARIPARARDVLGVRDRDPVGQRI